MTHKQARRTYVLKVGTAFLAAWVLLMGVFVLSARAQDAPQQIYILDHPIDPSLRIAATPDGSFPFSPLQGTDCSWLHSDMNAVVLGSQDRLWLLSDDSGDACYIAVQDRVDSSPCLTNSDGQCDIEEEHHFG